jgi:hypothetical protein
MPQLTPHSIVAATPRQLSSDLSGGAVILNLADGTYYGLDEVGASVWKMLDRPRSVAELRDRVVEEFDVTLEECEADLLDLLRDLERHALVSIRDADSS